MKAKILLFFISIGIYYTADCQKIIINGEETSRKLRWTDFTGKADYSSRYSAFTRWKVSFKLAGVKFIGDSVIIKDFQVVLQLDPEKSWVKRNKETDELLIHEQGHFNVGILCMNEMLQIIKDTSFTRNDFLSGIQNVTQRIIKKYNELDLRYDEETRHGIKKDEQEKWNNFFLLRLAN